VRGRVDEELVAGVRLGEGRRGGFAETGSLREIGSGDQRGREESGTNAGRR
jgi:hypothetical protein